MKFTLEMNLDNDAFSDQPGWEIARILNRLGNRLVAHPDLMTGLNGDFFDSKGSLHDKNGNGVGHWEIHQ